jgi:hypothetical protein
MLEQICYDRVSAGELFKIVCHDQGGPMPDVGKQLRRCARVGRHVENLADRGPPWRRVDALACLVEISFWMARTASAPRVMTVSCSAM